MPTSLDLREKRANAWQQAKDLLDRIESENRSMTAEETAQFNAWDTEMTGYGTRISALEKLESVRFGTPVAEDVYEKAGIERPGTTVPGKIVTPGDTSPEAMALHRDALMDYLRHGESGMHIDNKHILAGYRNAMQTTSGGAGGYLVPPAFRAGVIEAMKAFGGMRVSGAQIIGTAEGQDLPFATNDDTGNVGEILSEGATASEANPTFGQVILKAYVYSSKVVRVSNQLLNDSAFGLEGWLTGVFATRLGRITNQHFTSGSGANEPSGILGDATLGVTAAAVGAVTFDEIQDLIHSVDPAYRGAPSFGLMFHDQTLRDLKKLKDGDGQYLWSMGTTSGEPDRIAGVRYTINQDMPVMATGNKAILAGDFSNYVIRDVEGMVVRRLEELYALQNQVAFIAFSRHDGGLIDAGMHPVKYIQML